MVNDTGKLGHHHADVFCSFRWFCIHQLLYRQDIAEVIVHRIEVIQAIGERDVHEESVSLADLFVIAMQIAHHRLEINDGLPFQPHHHAEHTMSRWMLRSEVNNDLIGG